MDDGWMMDDGRKIQERFYTVVSHPKLRTEKDKNSTVAPNIYIDATQRNATQPYEWPCSDENLRHRFDRIVAYIIAYVH